jgi:hypothetical protein
MLDPGFTLSREMIINKILDQNCFFSFNYELSHALKAIHFEPKLKYKLSMIDLLINVACFETKVNNIFNLKSN